MRYGRVGHVGRTVDCGRAVTPDDGNALAVRAQARGQFAADAAAGTGDQGKPGVGNGWVHAGSRVRDRVRGNGNGLVLRPPEFNSLVLANCP